MTSPPNTVSLRFGAGGGRTVHLSRWIADRGFQRSYCNRVVGHFLGAASKKVDGRLVYGTSAIKLCRRCAHQNQAAVCDGIIAFFAWAGRLPLDPIRRDQLVPVGAGDRLGQLVPVGAESDRDWAHRLEGALLRFGAVGEAELARCRREARR